MNRAEEGEKEVGDEASTIYPGKIIGLLRQAEVELAQGKRVGEVCRGLGISEQSYYRWRSEYGGLKLEQVRRMKDLEKENGRLKKGSRADAGQADSQRGARGKLLSPERRRQCVVHLQQRLGISERRACRTIGQPVRPSANRTWSAMMRRHSVRRLFDWPALMAAMATGASRLCCAPTAGGSMPSGCNASGGGRG
jgi:putative transposase